MAISWNYNDEEANVQSFVLIPEGKHLCRIDKAEEGQSKKGYPQIVLELAISGYSSHVWDYITFIPDNTKMVNQKLGSIYNAFGIAKGNLNAQSWIGKVGGVCIKHDTYNGDKQAKVRYFCEKPKDAVWKNADGSTVSSDSVPMNVSPDDLPF